MYESLEKVEEHMWPLPLPMSRTLCGLFIESHSSSGKRSRHGNSVRRLCINISWGDPSPEDEREFFENNCTIRFDESKAVQVVRKSISVALEKNNSTLLLRFLKQFEYFLG